MTAPEESPLPASDPLYAFLAGRAFPNGAAGHPDIWFSPLDGGNRIVFRFLDRRTSASVVGKFYGRKWIHGSQTGNVDLRRRLMREEFEKLCLIRSHGFDRFPHYAVRPLATSEELDCLLLVEYARGVNLHHCIWEAFAQNHLEQLRDRVADTAHCLADLHDRTRGNGPLEPSPGIQYLTKLIGQLTHWSLIDATLRSRLETLRDRWESSGILRDGKPALTHGDATPEHFLYSGAHNVTMIDGETAGTGDPAMDLGYLVGELKHLSICYSGDFWAAEPYIRHFYSVYAERIRPGAESFDALTTRGRFFMGCCELRICRNAWIDIEHRRRLLEDAEACLLL